MTRGVRTLIHAVLSSAALASLVLTLGCSAYLHDDNVQKETGDALVTYKSVDVLNAVAAVVKSQADLDRKYLSAATAQQEAEREKEIVLLLAGTDNSRGVVSANRIPVDQGLKSRVNARIKMLAGEPFSDADLARLETYPIAIEKARNQLRTASDNVAVFAARYSAVGGRDFASCGVFAVPKGGTRAQLKAAHELQSACGMERRSQHGLQTILGLMMKPGCSATGGALTAVCKKLTARWAQVKVDQVAAAKIAKQLAAAKAAFKKATANSTGLDHNVTAALVALNASIKKADQVVGGVGGKRYEPGAALAAIQFRKTNICDVIAASAKVTCSGSGASGKSATNVETAMVGIIAGVGDLANPLPSSSSSALQIALAYQTGLENGAKARLTGLRDAVSLLESEEATMAHELTLLSRAKAELGAYAVAEKLGACSGRSAQWLNSEHSTSRRTFSTKVIYKGGCTAAEDLGRALLDFNRSWTEGRIPERVDEIKLEQESRKIDLQVAQANAVAWDGAIKAAMTQLNAFGQGGVAPEAIANFLKLAGLAVIARGVN